jgi:hypothetical protein
LDLLNKPQERPLHIGWVKHLKDRPSQDKFIQSLQSAQHVLRVLKGLIEEEKEMLRRSESSLSDFDSPAWSEKQAFRNGERRGLKFVEDLLDFVH